MKSSVIGLLRVLPRRNAGFWSHVELGPKDPILGVTENFRADKDPKKVNVGVGAYRDDDGKPWTLPSVAEAEKRIIGQDHEYAPIGGLQSFVDSSINLAYGKSSPAVTEKRIAALQALSGTGALRLSAEFLAAWPLGAKPIVWLPNPTWGNHFPIFNHAGLETKTYRYWNPKTLGLDLKGMVEDIRKAPRGVVLLHSCAHNPTGVDPTPSDWKEISKACKDGGHFVVFDNAYQGFASGDTEKDVASVRQFIEDGHKIALCQSFAKNFGLYGERIGTFSILCETPDEAVRVESQLKIIARAIYSNPPIYGARIVAKVLGDPVLTSMWQAEIRKMSQRIIDMRALLKKNLQELGSKKNWDHITNQIGMFSYTGLTPEQCDAMTANHHIYLTRNGRISMAGVTSKNVLHLAEAIHAATK